MIEPLKFDPESVERVTVVKAPDDGMGVWYAVHASDYDKLLSLYREIRQSVQTVVSTFQADEDQGYRSRDRQYALGILKRVKS